ncbi:MAG: hypothetical protein H6628_01320 [Calditrichae bacterium]|nr:hypothetical protein [Calditrichia bacterium]
MEITLYFKSSSPQPLFTLADSRSLIHRYRYSLSELPDDGYRPRAADDRIGHFYTSTRIIPARCATIPMFATSTAGIW